EQDGKRAKNDDVAGSSGNAEKGRPRAGALQSLHPTDRRSARGAPIDEGGELLDGWRLEKRRKGQTAAESFFDLGKNSRRHQRPSADFKKIVSDSEARTFEQFLPDFNQLAFRVSAGLDALVFADGNLGRRRLEIRPDVRIAAVEADHQLRMIGAQGEAERLDALGQGEREISLRLGGRLLFRSTAVHAGVGPGTPHQAVAAPAQRALMLGKPLQQRVRGGISSVAVAAEITE